jgi:hypothetical protein
MERYNSYSTQTVKKLFEFGNECYEGGINDYAVLDKLNAMGFTDDISWHLVAAGMKYGDRITTIEEKWWYRIGAPRICEEGDYYYCSFNFAEEKSEMGISVATSEWLESFKAIFFGAHDDEKLKNRGIYKIKGIQIGFGGDDEPVIYATDWAEKTRIRSVSGLKKALKNNK